MWSGTYVRKKNGKVLSIFHRNLKKKIRLWGRKMAQLAILAPWVGALELK